jgi:hypothetical protein
MTLELARTVAQEEAQRAAKAFVIYRFPGWPPGCWGVRAADQALPPNAEVSDRIGPESANPDPPGAAPDPRPARRKDTRQGSLF